jgi:hypothetical protein
MEKNYWADQRLLSVGMITQAPSVSHLALNIGSSTEKSRQLRKTLSSWRPISLSCYYPVNSI